MVQHSLKTSSRGQFQPPYGWLDADASNGHSLIGFRVDMLELQNIPNQNAWSKDDVEYHCTYTLFQPQYLKGNIDTTGDGTKGAKRALKSSKPTANTTISLTDQSGHRRKLVVSNDEGQSAQELCDSDKSCGPDFVSTAKAKYCDISEKKTYRL
ncbi:MAG: hypothetical protein Q9173_007181, partial [Seirophora scorigena]